MLKTYMLALLSAYFLSACGGSDNSSHEIAPIVEIPSLPGAVALSPPVIQLFKKQISFGDSLSDVGTYAVGAVKTMGGGKFTINGDDSLNSALSGKIWVEQLAEHLALPAPCAAQTGLDGNVSMGVPVSVVNHAECFAYAQGGARVTKSADPDDNDFGAMAMPVAEQIKRHLQVSDGKFRQDDLVLVMAGANDLLFALDALSDGAENARQDAFDPSLAHGLVGKVGDRVSAVNAILAAMKLERARPQSTDSSVIQVAVDTAALEPGNAAVREASVYGPLAEKADQDGDTAQALYVVGKTPDLMAAMTAAGKDLVDLVKHQILANGAQYVVVNNLPDVAVTPGGRDEGPVVQLLIAAMSQAFNDQLSAALADEPRVLLVDVYALTQDAANNPDVYKLANVTGRACDLSDAKNPLQSSLICSSENLNTGDVSRYAYADDNHPTPYSHGLLAERVQTDMSKRQWQ